MADCPEESIGLSSSDCGNDSNALILPRKKKNKATVKTKIISKVHTQKGLTSSQKRKFKKLEEEKKKNQLLSESVETLRKCKIDGDFYKLLTSTRNLGQEKRKRITHTDRRTKAKFFDDVSSLSETEDEACLPQVYEDMIDVLEPLVVQNEAINRDSVLLDSTMQPHSGDDLKCNNVSNVNFSIGDIRVEDAQSNEVTIGALPADSLSMKEDNAAMDEAPNYKFGSTKSVANRSVQEAATRVVHALRSAEVESKREDLPTVMMEQEIMEAINENSCVIISGGTGCGKTTQVPQFLYEAGFGSKLWSMSCGMIGVTQPRRVAVYATARRVAFELQQCVGEKVGFQVRYDKRIGEDCAIKFMTDGILLQELKRDFLLKHYSVIILDEVHERSLNTDILIGMLSVVVRARQISYEEQKKVLPGKTTDEPKIYPLKLILMSATLRVEDFTVGERIFGERIKHIKVETQQHKVQIHFSKRTELADYIGQAYKKVLSIHKKLPPGGILVFVTGQREVENLYSKLCKASKDLVRKSSKVDGNEVGTDTNLNVFDGYDMKETSDALQTDGCSLYDEPHNKAGDDTLDFSYQSESESDIESETDFDHMLQANNYEPDDSDLLGQNGSLDTLKAAFAALAGKTATKQPEVVDKKKFLATDGCCDEPEARQCEKRGGSPMCVYRLYGMLPPAEQRHAFRKVKEGERLVVVATNVAETSLTIPGIKYVVDTGREKVKLYDSSSGIESYKIQWISKASATQRAGRAGRTGPGHCYRLYSSAAFNTQFPEFSCPEILNAPIDGALLLLRSLGISQAQVAKFPFPTPPKEKSLKDAEDCLKALEALDEEGNMTHLGRIMSQYPMSPRHSRMLLTAIQDINKKKHSVRSNLVLAFAVAAAAALSVSNPFHFLQCQESDDNSDAAITGKGKELRETLKLSRAKFSNTRSDALTVAYALQCFDSAENQQEFCHNHALQLNIMDEMSQLRMQLLELVLQPTTLLEKRYTWSQGGLQDVEDAWKAGPFEKNPLSLIEEDLLLEAICAGWVDRVAKRKVNALSYQTCASKVEEKVYLHRQSSVSKTAPEFVIYSELLLQHTNRPYIRVASLVQSDWLVRYCEFSDHLPRIKPGYDPRTDQVYCYKTPYFGPQRWELRHHKMPIGDAVFRVTVFAYALLDGQVLPCMKLETCRNFMAAQPSSILKPECMVHTRVADLLHKLNRLKVENRVMLREMWKSNPMELHAEIRCWFQSGFDSRFEQLWKTMHKEALLS